ncbi:MAG: FIST C-terminal domain-containing protein [Actinomycetota bacterium]|nr:FIST C-terminal domain-containing protein [Actinomycetota bacterium]
MQWATSISRRTSIDDALRECSEDVREQLGPGPITLALGFVTPHFAAYYSQAPELVARHLEPGTFVGCSGGGVIGGGEEVEREPAVTLISARLPDVDVRPIRVGEDLPDLDGPPDAWRRLVGVRPEDEPQFVLLADPFSIRTEALLAGLDYAFPSSPKIGGLASGGTSPGLNALFLDGEDFTNGAVGVALTGDVAIDTVVAQGCRPIGETMQVTRCNGNFLYELDGEPAFQVLQELFDGLNGRDQQLASTALFVGVLMDEFSEKPQVGDFLIRNLIGIDPQRGAVAVGENLQEGMRLRFHVRDSETSAEDLRAMLDGYNKITPDHADVSGALLFSCLGRGEGLYKKPNFDTGVFRQHLGDLPVGGFFCNGEIGPVGDSTFLHGYTSAFGLFRPK